MEVGELKFYYRTRRPNCRAFQNGKWPGTDRTLRNENNSSGRNENINSISIVKFYYYFFFFNQIPQFRQILRYFIMLAEREQKIFNCAESRGASLSI